MDWNKPTGNSSLTLGSVNNLGIKSEIMHKILNSKYFFKPGFGMAIANYRIEKKLARMKKGS
jgi:hypothetical protein